MLIIDRFEGDWAVIEFGEKTFNLPRVCLPKEAKEGDVIRLSVTIDQSATEERAKMVGKLADELFRE